MRPEIPTPGRNLGPEIPNPLKGTWDQRYLPTPLWTE